MFFSSRNQVLSSILYCFAQMLYWSSGFVTVGYAAAYLAGIGFSNSSIGLITAVSGLASFAVTLCLSIWIDRGEDRCTYFAIIGILIFQQLIISGIASFRRPGSLPALLYTLFLSLGHVMNSLFSKLYIDLKKRGLPIDFGFARGLGSLAYAGCSFFVGYLLAQRPGLFVHSLTRLFYILLLVVTIVLLGMTCRLPRMAAPASAPERPRAQRRISTFLRKYRFFLILAAGISLVSASNQTFTTFLVNLVTELGGDVRHFTTITGFLALIEIPVMFFFSRLRRKSSLSAMLIISLLLYTIKLGGAAAAQSLPVLFAAVSAQAFASGLYQPARVEFIRNAISHSDTAKCQAILDGLPVFVAFATTYGFGTLLDLVSTRIVCLWLFLLSLLGTIASRAVISKVRSDPAEQGAV